MAVLEAQRKKLSGFQETRKSELREVEKLQNEIHEEKMTKIRKKKQTQDECQKIIAMNEVEKKKRLIQLRKDREEDARMYERLQAIALAKEKQRQADIAERAAKV